MVFKAKYKRVLAGFESTFSNGLDDLLGRQVVDHGVAVGDVGLLLTIPEVKFNASEKYLIIFAFLYFLFLSFAIFIEAYFRPQKVTGMLDKSCFKPEKATQAYYQIM